VRPIEHTDDAAVLEHGRRTTPAGDETFHGNRVKRVVGRERGSIAIGGVGHKESARRARDPVGRYQADISSTVDHRQHAAR
jgi:hypothetical protein